MSGRCYTQRNPSCARMHAGLRLFRAALFAFTARRRLGRRSSGIPVVTVQIPATSCQARLRTMVLLTQSLRVRGCQSCAKVLPQTKPWSPNGNREQSRCLADGTDLHHHHDFCRVLSTCCSLPLPLSSVSAPAFAYCLCQCLCPRVIGCLHCGHPCMCFIGGRA